jgi:hypothetical protein
MKRMIISVSAFAAILNALCFGEPPVDPADYVLGSYELSPAQEETYNEKDGELSPFWSAWEGTSGDKLDCVRELPSTHGAAADPDGTTYGKCEYRIPGFSAGEDDAQLTIKSAYGAKGLYLWVRAIDDDFVGLIASPFGNREPTGEEAKTYAGAEHWMNDCFDMMLDIYNSTDIKDHRGIEPNDQQTLTSIQYQFRFGSSEPASVVRVNTVDPTWQGCGVNEDCWLRIIYNQVSLEEAKTRYGILIETVNSGEHSKSHEWLIPLGMVGGGGGISFPAKGARISVALQYNDMDGGGTGLENLDFLFLKGYASPFFHTEVIDNCGLEWNWGDIEFGGRLDQYASPETPMISTPYHVHRSDGRPRRYYLLNGSPISLPSRVTRSGGDCVIVQRKGLNSSRPAVVFH